VIKTIMYKVSDCFASLGVSEIGSYYDLAVETGSFSSQMGSANEIITNGTRKLT